jgi:hypothetical protein
VRVGGDREDDGDPEFARHIGSGQAADVGHPQVQQVDADRRQRSMRRMPRRVTTRNGHAAADGMGSRSSGMRP